MVASGVIFIGAGIVTGTTQVDPQWLTTALTIIGLIGNVIAFAITLPKLS